MLFHCRYLLEDLQSTSDLMRILLRAHSRYEMMVVLYLYFALVWDSAMLIVLYPPLIQLNSGKENFGKKRGRVALIRT